jgi:hypothetical protein
MREDRRDREQRGAGGQSVRAKATMFLYIIMLTRSALVLARTLECRAMFGMLVPSGVSSG